MGRGGKPISTLMRLSPSLKEYDTHPPSFSFFNIVFFFLWQPVLWNTSADPTRNRRYGPHAQRSCGEGRHCTQRFCRATHKTKSAGYIWFRSVTTQGWTYKMLFGLAAAVEEKQLLPVYQLCPFPRSKPEPQLNIPLFKHCV